VLPNTQSQSNPRTISSVTIRVTLPRIARRALPTLVVLVAWLLLRSLRNRSAASLQNEAFITGYSLAAICALLLLLAMRKRIVSIPMGRMAIWQQSHHYMGLFCVGAYALHASFITTGWLESALAINFWAIALSGIVGWYVNHTAPSLLRAAGAQILRQDIPARTKDIAMQAYDLALVSAGNNSSAALADHYQNCLSPFFSSKRHWFYRMSPTGSKRRRLLAQLENVDRYLDEDGRDQRKKMSLLVQAKDDLDFQRAIQNRIRLWASAHAWVLGSFIVLVIAHVAAVHQFTSAW
jgi:hypothetical protein